MLSNEIYDIEKPLIKDDKWLIFPKSTFSQINTMDCNDAMAGECYNDKTFNQCIQVCEESPECDFGYFITDTPDNKDICVPLRDSNINSNPMYRLRKQDIYQELQGTESNVFINKKKYPFPPKKANNVFFMDNFLIENVETNTFLETSPINNSNTTTPVSFKKDGNLIVQLLQVPPDLSSGTQYVPVKYGDLLMFNIPSTSLVMRANPLHDKELEWVSRSFSIAPDISYNIEPIMPGKEKGDEVLYSDVFSLQLSVFIIGVDSTSNVERLYYNSYEQAVEKKENITFRFIPKMKGWYCNNDFKCTEIPLEKMTVNKDGIGTYNKLAVGRNPGCWGACKYKIKDQPRLHPIDEYKNTESSTHVLWFIIPSILIVICICIVIYKRH
jgi:hypothetical protein